ncbi:MAG: hypothetical protein U0796_06065 [Gemmatales bacterium]
MDQVVNIQCPNGHLVAIDVQYLGRKVRCPHCQVVMVAPRLATAAPVMAPTVVEDEEDEELEEEAAPRKRKKKGSAYRKGMKHVCQAFHFYYVRLYVIVVAILLTFVISLIGVSMGRPETYGQRSTAAPALDPSMRIAMRIVMSLTMLTAAVLEIIALVHAASTPESTKARGNYWTYLALTICTYVFAFVNALLPENAGPWGTILTSLMSFAAFVVFILYTKKIAIYIDEKPLATKAHGLMGLATLGILMIGLGNSGLEACRQYENNDFSGVLVFMGTILIFVAGIWSILRYVRLLTQMRLALQKATKS